MISQEERTAKKQHTCDWCGEPIYAGEQYIRTAYKQDGEIRTWKGHCRCEEIANILQSSGFCEPDDDGLTKEEFEDACHELCETVIRPMYGTDDCGLYYCTDVIYDVLTKYELYFDDQGNGLGTWKLRKKALYEVAEAAVEAGNVFHRLAEDVRKSIGKLLGL